MGKHNQRSFEMVSVNVEQLSKLIRDMEQAANNLTADLETEEKRARISDPQHFAYPPLASAIRARRDRLAQSIGALRAKLNEATQRAEYSRAA